jgi:hypothetical protein
MATSETDVLANYLLRPSSLTSILTFEQFQSFFPTQLHDKPELRGLFRDLRAQRDVVLATVEANIEEESRRGNVMRKEVLKARQGAAAAAEEDVDGEVELERAVCLLGASCTHVVETNLAPVRSYLATTQALRKRNIHSRPSSPSSTAPQAHSKLKSRSSTKKKPRYQSRSSRQLGP